MPDLEAAVEVGERRFRALIEHSMDGIAILCADGRISVGAEDRFNKPVNQEALLAALRRHIPRGGWATGRAALGGSRASGGRA